MPAMTPMQYIVKTGACNVGELSQLMRTDKPGAEKLRGWAVEEMTALGLEVA